MNTRIQTSALFLLGTVLLQDASFTHAADPVIHVQWDQGGTPILNVHYSVKTTSPASPEFPDIELLTGHLDWRIWSTDTDNPGGVGDIGVISCPTADNFAIAVTDDSDGPGARDMKAVSLVPSSSTNYSSIRTTGFHGLYITGDLTDELTVQASTSGTGGEADVFVGGPVTADLTIPKLNYFGTTDEFSGTMEVDELSGNIDIAELSGSVSIGMANGDSTVIRIFLPVSGSVSVSYVTSDQFVVFFPSGIAESGLLALGDVQVGQGNLALGSIPPDHTATEIAGTIAFFSGIPAEVDVRIDSRLGSTGVIDLSDMGVAGSLRLYGGGNGTIMNGGAVTGTVVLGLLQGFPASPYAFTGTAEFASVDAGGKIKTESTSLLADLTVDGLMNGDLCALNLGPNATLASNIVIGCGIGTSGTICEGEHLCYETGIVGADPADGTRDARQPHPPGDNSLGARQGIGSGNAYTSGPEPITLTLAAANARSLNHDCWTLCETGVEQTEGDELEPNELNCLTEVGGGDYEFVLARPISAGHWTTITYEGDGSYVTYSSMPADANNDGTSAAPDILKHIDCCLNHVCTPAYGEYTCDIDHSGAVTPADYTRLIDLLNGAQTFITWLDKSIATNTCPAGGESAMAGGESSLAGSALPEGASYSDVGMAAYMDGLVDLLTRLEVNDRIDESGLAELVTGLSDFSVQILAYEEQQALADALEDPELTFASEIVVNMIPGVVTSLRESD